MKLWILFLCAVAAGVSAQSDEADALDWNDEWNDNYDDEWFRSQLEKLGIYNDEEKDIQEDSAASVGSLEKDQDEMDMQVEEEIKNFQKIEGDGEKIEDYQFEDNRSEQSENLGDGDKAEPIHDTDDGNNQDVSLSASEDDYDDYALKPEDDFEPVFGDEDLEPEPKFSKDDDIAPLESPQSSEEIRRILEEAQAIIKEEEQKPNDFANDEVKLESDENSGIIKETKDILDGESQEPNDFAANVSNEDDKNSETFDDEIQKDIDDNLSDNILDKDEETVDKVYEDLNEDLDKLFETFEKLKQSVENEDDQQIKPDDVDYAVNSEENLDNKSDYENIFDSNLSDIFAKHNLKDTRDQVEAKDNEPDDEPINDTSIEEAIESAEQGLESLPYLNNALFEAKNNETDDEPINDTSIEEVIESAEQVFKELPYLNDALLSDDKEEKTVKSVSVEELSDDQLGQLMKDFAIQHSDAFDVDPFADNHLVNEIELEYGETRVITSENYPSGYPTNRIVDWIITGKGQGIELNVTDFAVNSALGDYLMVKPGQLDDSGDEGLIFSYHLNQPRAFRFMDVDRIFIRFDAKVGMSFFRGFSLTLKMIAPLPQDPEPMPEPEPVLPEPRHTLTVLLGGPTLLEFQKIRDDFRLFVADMATMYINANDIEPGMNTTTEITQLISASSCNIHWPGYEHCSQVKFSVPLVYEDDEEPRLNEADLQAMWETYVDMDPFAARLRQMGIEEFSVPNDGGVLTVWLVIGLGVVVSAAMLAFALWRYSCIEDYSRMPAFSDTDSLHEKRSSALYPTPHQMLPPLYPENDYDSTRVDMGYTNRSYTRTDMYDLESDEDVVVSRDRNAGIQPRDIFSV